MLVPKAIDEQRADVALGCRILASRGLSDGFLGHISLRTDDGCVLVRCRGGDERGLAWTTPEDVRLVTLEGEPASAGELNSWRLPAEFAMHQELLRARSDVFSVVHAHPAAVVAADLAGISIRPIVGAFDIPGARLARSGVPVYRRSVLIRSPMLAAELRTALGDKDVVVLRGHGVTSTGGSVKEAVLRAVAVQTIAEMALRIVSAGGRLQDIDDRDFDDLPDLGSELNLLTAWRHEVARLGGGTT